jgi:hypothetical protein
MVLVPTRISMVLSRRAVRTNYRDRIDPADIVAPSWPGRVFAPGQRGLIVNGGPWSTSPASGA